MPKLTQVYDEPCDFLAETRVLLKDVLTRHPVSMVVMKTGLPHSWVNAMSKETDRGPNVNRVHYLNAKLKELNL